VFSVERGVSLVDNFLYVYSIVCSGELVTMLVLLWGV
jgi:hypothetical protein